jgi:hypothetical protein
LPVVGIIIIIIIIATVGALYQFSWFIMYEVHTR